MRAASGPAAGWRADGGASFLLAASARESDGRDLYFAEFDTPDQNQGVATGLDYERGERLLARAASGELTVTLMHARRVKGVPTASFYQAFNDPRSRTTDRQSYLSAAWHTTAAKPHRLARAPVLGQLRFLRRLYQRRPAAFGQPRRQRLALVGRRAVAGRHPLHRPHGAG
ncbi:hypothetical protein LP419_37035 [Massilia sp. H-1]|nr:hypothetical protein LP419_37035 [Massilia sp. H-1]